MIRILRANLLDELHKPYVVSARARGIPESRVIVKYPVRVALNPFASTLGYLFPLIVSGSIIVSIVLGLPTVGPLLLRALVESFAVSFIRAVTNVSIVVFLIAPGQLVATFVILGMIQSNTWGAAAVLTTLLLLLTFAAIAVTSLTAGRFVRGVAMAISGGLSGMVAINEVLGYRYRYYDSFSPGYGFTGIAVALLGRNHPVGVLLAWRPDRSRVRSTPVRQAAVRPWWNLWLALAFDAVTMLGITVTIAAGDRRRRAGHTSGHRPSTRGPDVR